MTKGAPKTRASAAKSRAPRGVLLEGDCLEIVPQAAARGPFDLVYLDPPFDTRAHHGVRTGSGERARGQRAYKDSWGGIDAFLGKRSPVWPSR